MPKLFTSIHDARAYLSVNGLLGMVHESNAIGRKGFIATLFHAGRMWALVDSTLMIELRDW